MVETGQGKGPQDVVVEEGSTPYILWRTALSMRNTTVCRSVVSLTTLVLQV